MRRRQEEFGSKISERKWTNGTELICRTIPASLIIQLWPLRPRPTMRKHQLLAHSPPCEKPFWDELWHFSKIKSFFHIKTTSSEGWACPSATASSWNDTKGSLDYAPRVFLSLWSAEDVLTYSWRQTERGGRSWGGKNPRCRFCRNWRGSVCRSMEKAFPF